MSRTTRVVVAGYIMAVTLALLAGRWPLQGPVLLAISAGHGLHLGDALVLLVSAWMSLEVLRPRH